MVAPSNLTMGTALGSFFRSLCWVPVILISAVFFGMVSDAIVVDFVNVNPARSRLNAVSTSFIFPPLFFIYFFICSNITFLCSQLIQAVIATISTNRFGRRLYLVALSIPLVTLASWYCYDYLVFSFPSIAPNMDPDWEPFRHGLTFHRYLVMLGAQSSITLFSLIRFKLELDNNRRLRWIITLIVIGVVSAIGAIGGAGAGGS